MSFLKALFGKREAAPDAPAAGAETEHRGFTIVAAPFKEGGQFQTAGFVRREIGGTLREHRFIRADKHTSRDEAVEFSLSKGRQIVDEQGDRLFD